MEAPTPTSCVIALGSNLQDPMQQITSAIEHIKQLPQTTVVAISSWYQSQAIGPGEQPDYINGAIEISTALTPQTLLKQLQNIENKQQRVRSTRWGARTLDLDILLYGDRIIDEPDLTVPHPRMLERNFVLFPLHDIDPERRLPDGQPVAHHKNKLTDAGLQLVGGTSSPTMHGKLS